MSLVYVAILNLFMVLNKVLNRRVTSLTEILIIVALSFFPLFFNFPYRVNIFLSWEGSYRMYLDQVPYKDFGLPMGFGYWIIPSLFFKIFGPYLFSLIKAQVLINLLSGFTFRSILSTLEVKPVQKLLSVILYCISYSFFNFWPWYNHTVFVYEILGINFVLLAILGNPSKNWKLYLYLFLGAFFTFLSLFTKQDAGAIGFVICVVLLAYHTFVDKSFKEILLFIAFFGITACCFILPFAQHGFFYWFNYGQPPHNSRITIADFLHEIFGFSHWIKFYLFAVALILINSIKDFRVFILQKREVIFTLLTLGILGEALLIQVTSYTPPDNNIYFHSFAFAFIISAINFNIIVEKLYVTVIAVVMLLFWWSGVYWKYIQSILTRYTNIEITNLSTRSVKIEEDSTLIDMSQWKLSGLKSFDRIYLPGPTVDGMKRLMESDAIKNKKNPKVLNMSELTPLASEIGYELEKGLPLWYHQDVSIFDKEVDFFAKRIEEDYYDMVLFETIPYLENFYPEKIRQTLIKHYKLQDKFLAPRRPTDSWIEVYVKK